jgi:hypothetical protein
MLFLLAVNAKCERIELAKLARRDRQHFECNLGAQCSSDAEGKNFKKEVEKELTGRETESNFKLCHGQTPVVAKAIETAALITRK